MKLARIGPAGDERPVLVDQSGPLRDLGDVIVDVNAATISREGLSRLAELDPDLLPSSGRTAFGSARPSPISERSSGSA